MTLRPPGSAAFTTSSVAWLASLIDLGKCAAINTIYAHEAYVGPPSSKQMYARHKAIQDLYE